MFRAFWDSLLRFSGLIAWAISELSQIWRFLFGFALTVFLTISTLFYDVLGLVLNVISWVKVQIIYFVTKVVTGIAGVDYDVAPLVDWWARGDALFPITLALQNLFLLMNLAAAVLVFRAARKIISSILMVFG